MEDCFLTAHELLQDLQANKTDSSRILTSLKSRIEKVDPLLKAYVRRDQSACGACANASAGGTLKGLPVAIKDNICTVGFNTECCSRILSGFVPPYDATVIKKLKTSGATIFGLKTNMDEFAFGSSTENSCFGPSRNPWNPECVPGGSSGGSAVAVASDQAIFCLGFGYRRFDQAARCFLRGGWV